MVKRNELRIGNRLLYKPYGNRDGEPVTIAGLLGMQAYFNKHTNESGMYFHLVPIPLTPDILEKCGFEECDKSEYADVTAVPGSGWWEIDILHHRLLIAPMSQGHNLMCIYDDNDECVLWRKFLGFQYLHELQNLYFALTGEELNCQL